MTVYDSISLGSTDYGDGLRLIVGASNVWPLGSLAEIFDPADVVTPDSDDPTPFAATLVR